MAKKRIDKNDIAPKDLFENVIKGAEETKKQIDILTASMKALNEVAKSTKKAIGGGKISDTKSLKDFDELTRRANATAKAKLNIDKQLLNEKAKLSEQRRLQNKQIKTTIQATSRLTKEQQNSLGTLQKLEIHNTKLRATRAKLNLETQRGQRVLKQINAKLDENNAKIRASGDQMKKQRLNVGNYTSAFGKLKGMLAQLGVAFGVFSLVRNSFNVIKDFGQAQADLASVLGVNTDAMKGLTEQAKELGATTTFTASQVSELQKELAKLGFSQEQIQAMTQSTLQLAEATGTDLARASEVTGATLRGFGLDAEDTQRVVDVMAKSFSSSSLDMEKFATAMASVAPIAKNSGFTIEQTTALLGTLTDRGIDASTAGTGLRNMFLNAKKEGLTLNEALDKINNSSDKTATSFDLFGKRGATLGVILAENTDATSLLNDKLIEADGSAQTMADTQRNTLGGAIKLLKSAWEGLILKMNEAGGVGDKFRRGIVFLADNLETIVKVVGYAVEAFISFKTVMFAMKLNEQIGGFKGLSKSIKGVGESTTGATESAKGFGKALKGIGFAVAITLAIELVSAFNDIISGADRANRALKELERTQERVNNVVNKQIQSREYRLSNFKGTNAEKEKFILLLKEESKAQAVELKNLAQIELKRAESLNSLLKQNDLMVKSAELARRTGTPLTESQQQILSTLDAYHEARANANSLAESVNLLSIEYRDIGKVIDDENISLIENSSSTANNTYEINDNAQAKKDLNDELDKALNLRLEENKVNKVAFSVVGNLKREKATRNQQEAEYNFILKDTIQNKITLIQANADLEKLGKTPIEQQIIQAKAQKEIDGLTKKTVDNERLKQLAIQETTSILTKQIDERIKKINEEIDAHKKKASTLEELAKNGNITAKESLAEENRLIAQADREKEQQEKRKQQILLISSVLQSYNANLEAGQQSGEAFTNAVLSKAVLDSFIASLGSFYVGTEDTGKVSGQLDANGGRLAVLHNNERVMTAKQNAMIGNVSNNEVARVMEQRRLGNLVDSDKPVINFDNQLLVNELMSVSEKLDQVNKTIAEKPEIDVKVGEITSTAMKIVETHKRKGITTTNTFKVRAK